MPVVTRSQSKQLQLQELQDVLSDTLDTTINSIDNIQDRLTTDTSLIYELYEIETDPKHYKKIYGNKEHNSISDRYKLMENLILFLVLYLMLMVEFVILWCKKK